MNSTNPLVIAGETKNLGGFSVSRLIPQNDHVAVGPFVFVDHLGPMNVDHEHKLDVRPHPHIGLATATYLFKGRSYHRDSLGSRQIIQPGDLNWMTAGKGIVHSERTPKEDLAPSLTNDLHGIQVWIGLPVEQEECEPSFTHYPKESLPTLDFGREVEGRLLIGHYGSVQSPVLTASRTFFCDLHGLQPKDFIMTLDEIELGVLIVSGSAKVNSSEWLSKNELAILRSPNKKRIQIETTADTRLIVLGGTPFPEPRYKWWNFISSKKERLRKAAAAWKNGEMPKVPGETEFIPLPEDPLP
ncbi:MAG: pirin family protein [Bdellovibrionales bacterium]|jgi:redox-sensitive bicupin YhaK (pirin superfamily)|nr:pirin family protein [Bdellovibrionales bacterium]